MLPQRPRLREHLECVPVDHRRRAFVLRDRLRLSPCELPLSFVEWNWLSYLDGQHALEDFTNEAFLHLVRKLDTGLFLDGECWRAILASPIRPPACIGVYDEDPVEVRRQMQDLFGRPTPNPDASLRAVLLPHIDYARGWRVYAPGFRALVERNAARLFVIVGTSHYSPHRFTLTRRHFQTPLGIVETDQSAIDRLVSAYGDGLFDDELPAHFPEHSIELEVVPLQHLYGGERIRIVPLVVGSFHDCVGLRRDPLAQPDIVRMVAALQELERTTPEPICFIISGDLAHIGPKFGDSPPLHDHTLRHSAARDRRLLAEVTQADPEGYHEVIVEEADQRRVCGYAPTWLVLASTRPTSGQVLAFEQYVAPDRSESVSFAAAVFSRE